MNRLAIYMIFDSDGIVDDYIIYMINALKDICCNVIVVSNTYLPQAQKGKLKSICRLYERDNSGFDVGAYAEIITMLYESNELNMYQELLLLNDSVFGPFYDLEEMFKEMEYRTPYVDFWGITRRGSSDFDGGEEIYPEHIQSYCYIFRNRILHSKDFLDYWRRIGVRVTDFRSAILNYEFRLTQYFSERGYTWDSYCSCAEYITANPKHNLSPYHYGSYELIKKDRCPFLKRKLFTGDFIENKYTDARDLKLAVNYISNKTAYDVNMMWKYVLRKYNISQIVRSMQMVEVIDSESLTPKVNIESVYIVDIYENVTKIVNTAVLAKCKYILLLAADDSDIASLKKADVNCLKYNLCYSNTYIYNLAQMFEKEERLGVIIPPANVWGKISNSGSLKKFPIYKIKGAMCRKTLVTEKIITDMRKGNPEDIISMLPKAAQDNGFYTKIVINREYVSTWMTNSLFVNTSVIKMAGIEGGQDMDINELEDAHYKKVIHTFLQNNQKIYIYGAGQLACRVIDMIDDRSKIKGIIVSDTNGNSLRVKNIDVIRFDDYVKKEKDAGIIIAVGEKNNKTIIKKMEQNRFRNYLVLN